MIDNGYGVAPQVGLVGSNTQKSIKISQTKFFGETEAIECFTKPLGCYQAPESPLCYDRAAVMLTRSDELHVDVIYESVQFIGYSKNTTKCGNRQAIFTNDLEYPLGLHPSVNVKNATFINVKHDAWTRFTSNSTLLISFQDTLVNTPNITSFYLVSSYSIPLITW